MTPMVDLFISGTPKGQPRVRAYRRGDRAGVYDPGTADGWKQTVARGLGECALTIPPPRCPMRVRLMFTLPRPKAHYRANGELKPGAPYWVTTKPDADNLAKAVLDVLSTCRVWWDDAQVARLEVGKHYGEYPGCAIVVAQTEEP